MADWEEDTSITDLAAVDALAPPESVRAYLIVLTGPAMGEMHELTKAAAVIGRGKSIDVPLADEGVSRAHARVFTEGGSVYVEDLGSRNGTFLNGQRINVRLPLADGDKIQIGRTTILKFTYHDTLEESFQKQMYESALRDGLTRVFNRRYFGERLASEMRFAVRHKARLALLLLDIDHFKNVNDTRGHLAGDRVLVAVANVLTQSVRNEDVVARWGGEEFAVMLRATPLEHVLSTAERLRRTIEATAVADDAGRELRVTASLGVATFPEIAATNPGELIAAADAALYRAKHGGRNRVER